MRAREGWQGVCAEECVQVMALTRVWSGKFDIGNSKSVKVTTSIPTALIVMKWCVTYDFWCFSPLNPPPTTKSAAAGQLPRPPDHEISGARNRRRSRQPR